METVSRCPVCSSDSFSKYIQTKDFHVTGEEFNLDRCNSCGFVFTNPRPDETSIGRYYQSDNYISHTNKKSLFKSLYVTARGITLRKKQKLIAGLTEGRKLLDIGCGTGEFLAYCKGKGWTVQGSESEAAIRKHVLSVHGIELLGEDEIGKIALASVDAITMWHVLEHIHQLNHRLDLVKRILAPAGALVVAVPNRTCCEAGWYGKYWDGYDVPRHLYHFRADDIKNLMKRHGMRVEKILPMHFDSYYSCILSEKHKSGGFNYPKGIFNGLMSNLRASSKDHTYSSHTFIIRHQD